MMLTVDCLVNDGYLASLAGRPSHRRYKQVYDTILKPAFGGMLARELHRLQLIQFVQRPIAPEQKRKALALIQQSFRWGTNTVNPATGQLYYDGLNPAQDIPLARGRSRERVASTDELKRIMGDLPYLARNPRRKLQAAFFAVRLAAPCRISELVKSETRHWQPWEIVPGKPGYRWHKPTTKTGISQTVYVPWQAAAYMTSVNWSHTHVFPGLTKPHWGEYTAVSAWGRWMKELKIADLQLLDIRRTLVSYLYHMHRRQEVDDLTIKALLNHYDGRPVAIYTRLDTDYLAKIIQGYADWLWGLTPATPEAATTLTTVQALR